MPKAEKGLRSDMDNVIYNVNCDILAGGTFFIPRKKIKVLQKLRQLKNIYINYVLLSWRGGIFYVFL